MGKHKMPKVNVKNIKGPKGKNNVFDDTIRA